MPRAAKHPNAGTAEQAAKLAAAGCTAAQIGHVIGVSTKSLTRHYAKEMERGRSAAVAKLGSTLFQRAVGGCLVSTLFYLKCQGGWRETAKVEVTGADGKPFAPQGMILVPMADGDKWEASVAKRQAQLIADEKRMIERAAQGEADAG